MHQRFARLSGRCGYHHPTAQPAHSIRTPSGSVRFSAAHARSDHSGPLRNPTRKRGASRVCKPPIFLLPFEVLLMDSLISSHSRAETASSIISEVSEACESSPRHAATACNAGKNPQHFLPSGFTPVWDNVLADHRDAVAEQTMRIRWRSFWCNGFRHLAASHPLSYPSTAWGFERAIRVLAPLISSLMHDLSHRSDAWPSNDHLPESPSSLKVQDRGVSYCPPAPSSATLARWIRQDRARSNLRNRPDGANLDIVSA